MEIIFLYLCTRYSLINLCLIIGSLKEIRSLLLLWIAFTLGFLIWTFVLVAIMFTYDTTPNFVGGVAIAQLSNFAISGWLVIIWSLVSWVYLKLCIYMYIICNISLFQNLPCSFILVVFSLYQEIKQKRIKEMDGGGVGRGETYLQQPQT